MEPAGGHPVRTPPSARARGVVELPLQIEKIDDVANRELMAEIRETNANLAVKHPVLAHLVKRYEGEGALSTFRVLRAAAHLAAKVAEKDVEAEGSGEDKLQWECEHAAELARHLAEMDAHLDDLSQYGLSLVTWENYPDLLSLFQLLMPDPQQFEEFAKEVVRELISNRRDEFPPPTSRGDEALHALYLQRGIPEKPQVTRDNAVEVLERMATFLLPPRVSKVDAPEETRIPDEDFRMFANWVAEQLAEEGHFDEVANVSVLTKSLIGTSQLDPYLTKKLVTAAFQQGQFKLLAEWAERSKATLYLEIVIKQASLDKTLAFIRCLEGERGNSIIQTIIKRNSKACPKEFYEPILEHELSQKEPVGAGEIITALVEKLTKLGSVDEAVNLAFADSRNLEIIIRTLLNKKDRQSCEKALEIVEMLPPYIQEEYKMTVLNALKSH